MALVNGKQIKDLSIRETKLNIQDDLSLNGYKLTDVGNPVLDTDVANKYYVDAVAQGLDLKKSVLVATTADITLANEQTVDGVALVAGDRVLVKNQTDQSENGIYIVVDGGAWTRSEDADNQVSPPFPEVTSGMFTFVESGTVNSASGWVLITNDPIVIGVTNLVFSQFSGAGQIVAGDALTKTGNTLDVNVDFGVGASGSGGQATAVLGKGGNTWFMV